MASVTNKLTKRQLIQQIEDLYVTNLLSTVSIAKKLNLPYQTVRLYLKNTGLLRSRRQGQLTRHSGKINRDYFSKINSEEKAYFLGLLTADGCLQQKGCRVSLTLQKADKYMIRKFATIFSVSVYKSYSKKSKTYSYFCTISSEQLYNDLITLGLCPHKSHYLTGKIFNKIPVKYLPHFLRGFIDGDGWITISGKSKHQGRIGVVSTKSFIQSFRKKIYVTYNIKFGFAQNHQTPYIKVSILNKYSDVITFLNIIYKDASIYLKRKYSSYKKILKLKRYYKPKVSKYKGVSKTGSGKWVANLWYKGSTIKGNSKTSEYLAYVDYNRLKRKFKVKRV